MILRHRVIPASILIVGLTLSACTAGLSADPSPSGATGGGVATSAITAPTPSAGASEVVARSTATSGDAAGFACATLQGGPTTERAQLSDVRLGTHAGYDRVTFEFDAGLPRYTVEKATPPFTKDASGMPLSVDGSAFLRLTLHGATKVLPAGGLSYTGETELKPDYPMIVHVVEGGDFEAVSTWYIGLASEGCFRVTTLSSPARLVVDIED